ncbi:16S rRNA (cytidine(1402)-2'-O)-methyltransferase [Candidatus Daviesbacteria bacterium RIFCSPLOWO2_01_FULL_43_38]|uniref:Ribosomal RNA small subunit methyltransferase I n=3 Tax=Candidatus Daviesiibacteriota TaxID=1752718 RepID=A0A1F5JZR5_9BACT|nr:MAG: Ribosomal RNA small subunit methyltransferase I [Candidatus Daviesbacteria bacterium GW2011_GWA1_42_6]KKS70575.1 MAG: Ribosomal RNA small subunit methyltransferase I [Candidatus Daviesbacteria bacterium GW2011_GWA2_42_7]OGE20062.1 MAG: 16S rRNA (cytidine(1402)-2'-O)-methyltransferase [Candidatus Daviesbacteria bacterium RIFCSPHIGHO2_01_FULL_43_17]OGE34149.1 MAG: 16S rRNA (cytidine(1402)-2'-O)-methyltransferase [Candidatus Daviesbacteria bacterium RIFCSPHIGHO2_12_FULL_43_11]OGE63478.1 MA
MLYIVPTPIGNLKDITLRALEVLKEVDGIICEDTRRTGLLLSHFQIKKPLLVLNDYNEATTVPRLIAQLQSSQNLALVSDAGTPLVSDPGYKLVRECLTQGIAVDSLPGPSSILPALTLSGLPPDKFIFLGYLPEKPGHRLELLKKLTLIHESIRVTYIAYVAPHKLMKTLEDMQEVNGDIEVVLAHELTKIHQSVKMETITNWLEVFKKQPPKGEYVLLFNLGAP